MANLDVTDEVPTQAPPQVVAEMGPSASRALDRSVRRRGRRRWRRRPSWRAATGAAVGLVGLAAAGVLMSMQSPLAIRAISVQGVSPDLASQVDAAISTAVGDSFSSVASEQVAGRISAIEGIDGAQLHWAWWNTLIVDVIEPEPTAVLPAPNGGFVVVDSAGRTIRSVPERPAGLPVIEATQAAGREAALLVSQQIPSELAGQVEAVVGDSPASVSLRLNSGTTVLIGTPTDLALKFKIAGELAPTGATQVNVSVPERPAVQGIPAQPQE